MMTEDTLGYDLHRFLERVVAARLDIVIQSGHVSVGGRRAHAPLIGQTRQTGRRINRASQGRTRGSARRGRL